MSLLTTSSILLRHYLEKCRVSLSQYCRRRRRRKMQVDTTMMYFMLRMTNDEDEVHVTNNKYTKTIN